MTTDGGTGPATRLPLRARKQLRARQRAAEVASRIFSEKGYDGTSLEEIANEAEMSVSSLLRYFGGKERLALAHHIELLEALRAKLADESMPVIERWRAFIVDQAESARPYSSYEAERKLIVSHPPLLRLLSRIQLDQQDELAAAFAREAGVDLDDDLYGRLLAALLVAGNETVYIHWLKSGGQRDLKEVSLEVVDFAAQRLGTRDDAAHQVPQLGSPDDDVNDDDERGELDLDEDDNPGDHDHNDADATSLGEEPC